MGFGGVGLRSIGSRHLHDYAVVNRTIGSDAVTTDKIAPDTILEVDISPGAVGSREIAANAISYIDQIKDNIIGSSKLDSNSVYSIKIQADTIGHSKLTTGLQGSLGGNLGPDIIGTTELKEPSVNSDNIYNDAVGSQHIFYDGIAYPSQIKDAIIPEVKLQSHFEHGRIGSITITDFIAIKSITPPVAYHTRGIAFATDKKRIWACADGTDYYIFEIGTTTGNKIGSFLINNTGSFHAGIAFAPDKGRLWMVAQSIGFLDKPHILEIGTTLGDIKSNLAFGLSGIPNGAHFYGLTFAADNSRLWTLQVAAVTHDTYILEIGTTLGNIIQSIGVTSANSPYTPGIAFNHIRKKLWYDRSNSPIYLLGTIDGTVADQTTTFAASEIEYVQETNRLWLTNQPTNALRELGRIPGTYIHFSTPFSKKPDIGIAGIDQNEIFIEAPSLGSFRIKAGSYPAKAMWMAWGSR